MRPDVEAFRELDALVRKLTEQLSGYRRRALAAESRSRELEHQMAVLQARVAAGEAARRQLTETAHSSRAGKPVGDLANTNAERSSSEIALENERLRARLSDARDRTALVADRVRFLRQQLSSGADR